MSTDLPRARDVGVHVELEERRRRRRLAWRRRRWRRRRRVAVLAFAPLLALVLYSYISTMLQPSSLPLGIRSIEWVRANGAAWIVNDLESVYYRFNAPEKGGPGLSALPRIGSARLVSRRSSYEPRPIRPLLRPQLAGEGAWRSTGGQVGGAPPVLVTTYRPDPSYPRMVAYVAWIDHSRTSLALYPGRYEPPVGSPRGPMSVPAGERTLLLATFNSGFTSRDGHGGFAVNGNVYTPLRDGQATVVAYRGGKVDVVSWKAADHLGARVVLARQNLPLIVDNGIRTPNLADGSQWGATLGNAIRVWRSGIGVDRHGNLVYVAADYQTVGSLADIFLHVGAVRAMELDINAEWPSFITYRHTGALVPIKLLPNGQQPVSRYLRPDDRDFFAVYRRVPGGTLQVPFR